MARKLHRRRQILSATTALVVCVTLAACTSSDVDTTERDTAGEVVQGGEVGVERLQVGDCIAKAALEEPPADASASPQSTDIESLPAVPCTEPHGGEVVLVDQDFFADLTERPTDDELFDKATDPCLAAIKEYTGFDIDAYLTAEEEPDVDEIFAPFTLVPNQASWEQANDRSMVCIAVSTENDLETIQERTGSALV